jgi:alpha-galactosidase
MKIVLIGAGSAQFGFGTLGEALERVRSTAENFIAVNKLPFRLSASTDRRRILRGADFIIISIEVGNRFELWDMDWNLPLQYGIRQVYGENGGPGGLFHALRIVPPILDICADIAELCPRAFVFSYSNPMTAIVTTVLRKFPGLKFVGMCHEIASLERYLPAMLGAPVEKLKLRAAGLNHFSVLLEASYADTGKDAYPDILAKARAFFERLPGYSDIWEYAQRTGKFPETESSIRRYRIDATESARPWTDRTLFMEILDRFHLLPITWDSHVGEYIPWAYESADHRGILDFYAFYRRKLAKAEARIELKLKERFVPIVEGIIGDLGYEESAVNILNDGFIPDLPGFIAVEVPALVGKRGFTGVSFPAYPRGFGALLRNYSGVYDLTAEAILRGSRDYVIQALLVNPVVTSSSRVPELVDLMLDRQREWLGYIKA